MTTPFRTVRHPARVALALAVAGAGIALATSASAASAACPAPATEASGKCLVTFLADGTFTVPSGITKVDVLLVGGGGGGHGSSTATSSRAGGGGSGGTVGMETGFAVTPGAAIAVSVGPGGAGDSTWTTAPAQFGGASRFGDELIAPGGVSGFATSSGGSMTPYTSPGSGTGSAGGLGGVGVATAGGGGTGAGGLGTAGSGTTGGSGGVGLDVSSTFTVTGITKYGAGGGGGATSIGGQGGAQGGGIGGNGLAPSGINGANGYGGGGGGGNGAAGGVGGNGGSGVVIVQYPAPVTPAPAPSTPTITATVLVPRKALVTGQATQLAIRASNTGKVAAAGVTSCLNVPANLVITKVNGGTRTNGTVCFTVGDLAAGASATRSVTVRGIALRKVTRKVTGNVTATGVTEVAVADPVNVSIRPRAVRMVVVTG